MFDEAVYLYYSNRRLGPFGIDLGQRITRLQQRNSVEAGGTVELPRQNLTLKPSGKLRGNGDLASVVVAVRDGVPLCLRDLVEVVRGYEDPPRVLNFRTIKAEVTHSPALLGIEAAAESARPRRGRPRVGGARALD